MIKNFDAFVNETFGMDLPKGSDPITEKDSDSVMAKSQLNRTKEFVDMLIPIIDGMDDMEPWVQAKITKAEDYLNAVLNYYKGKDGISEGKDFEPHMMYDPKTGKGYKAEKEEDHVRMDKLGYVHEKPEKTDESTITEAKRGVIHKAAKKGSYPVSIVVIRDGKVIAQELVKTPAEVPAAFNVIQSYHKHKGATVHIESKTGERLFSESLDEAVLEGFDIEKLHFETDPKKAEKLKIELGKSHGEIGKRKQIESAEYSLRKFRKSINFGDGTYLGEFIPGSYDAATSTLGDGPHKKAVKKIKWNQKKYDQWLEDVASNDGWKNAFDMAQNAKNEPGLIDWVEKQFRGDDPLQRIQWDIEGFAESFNEAKKFYKTKDIVKMAKVAGDIVLDAKDDIQDLSVAYGDRVPAKELEKVLNNYDLDLEDVMESVVNEAEDYKYKKYVAKAFEKINGSMFEFRNAMGVKQLTNKDMELKRKFESIHQAIFDLQKEMKSDGLTESNLTEGKGQARLNHLRKFGIAPNNQPQNGAYIKSVSKPGKFFVDWEDAFKLGDVALEFIKSSGRESVFDIIDLKTMKRTGKQLDVKSGDLGNLRTTYGVRVNESINEGKVTKKSISKASDDLAKIIIELKDNLGKLQKSKTDEERAKYIEIAKDLTVKRKDASDSLNLAIAKLDKNAELDLSGKD